ncbi:heterokaryon incompatibility protein-domain-containing protein [Xylariaceae sp. FL0255]|nr:heterokaryon incompatibility protein-domain-containing protein [Xylariaceae sp. FL0255]
MVSLTGIGLMQRPPRESIPICPTCFNFQADLFPNKHWTTSNYEGYRELRVKFSYQGIKTQAEQDCDGCRVLHEGVKLVWKYDFDPEQVMVGFTEGKPAFVYLASSADGSGFLKDFWFYTALGSTCPWKLIGPISTTSPTFVLNQDRVSTFKGWLQNCDDNHPECRLGAVRITPKRLVDITSSGRGELFLAEDVEPGTPYVALSHSWKSSMPNPSDVILTRENIDQRLRSIPWAKLGATFHHAILIASHFDIRYLWIDSLCIIQDDDDDWAEQAAQMANIYENAYFTIACEYLPEGSPEDGCFLVRNSIRELPAWNLDGSQFSVFVQPSYSHYGDWKEGLSHRGWCVQEKFLSRRVLRFRESDVLFECAKGRSCECETLDINKGDVASFSSTFDMFNPVAGIIRRRDLDEGSVMPEIAQEYWTAWRTAVYNFSQASLTKETDRLPAMSGMASRMPREIVGDYIAGLWTGDLLEELFWSPRSDIPTPKHYEEWVGPSFSWVSLFCNCDWGLRDLGEGAKRVAEIIDAQSTPATIDPLGKVKSAFIRLRARIAKTRKDVYKGRPRDKYNQQYDPYRFDTEEDWDIYEGGKITFFAVEISYRHDHTRALLVRNSERTKGSFERVGYVVFDKLDFFENVEPTELTLV